MSALDELRETVGSFARARTGSDVARRVLAVDVADGTVRVLAELDERLRKQEVELNMLRETVVQLLKGGQQ